MVVSEPGPGDERKCQRKHRDVRARLALLDFRIGTARAGFAREHHLQRDQQQQQATEDAEGIEADAEHAQEQAAAKGEQQEDAAGDHHALARHAAPLVLRDTFCHGNEDRDDADGLDHHEEGDEELAAGGRSWCFAQN